MAPIWDFLGPYSPKYCLILLNLWPEVVSDQKNSIWEILQILEFWPKRNTVNLNILGPYWCPIYCRKTKNIAKTKISTKTACLAIINNVSPTSHKNHRILVKLSWKIFSGPKLGLHYHHGSKGHHHPSILSGCQVSASVYLSFSTLVRRKHYVYLVQDLFGHILGSLWAITLVNHDWSSWTFGLRLSS